MSELKNPLDVYKLLPKNNCGQCYLPTCLAFSAAVVSGGKKLADCPHLDPAVIAKFSGGGRATTLYDVQLAEKLDILKESVSRLDFAKTAAKIGAELVGDKIVVKSLGKNFTIDTLGNITSECHTHPGLAIPLLSYLSESSGKDVTGHWVPFRELKNGSAMNALFVKRGEQRLRKLADDHPDLFADLLSIFSGHIPENDFAADMSLALYPLPKVPVMICYWQPEDDLESRLNIFFDRSAEDHLRIESIFALGVGMVMMFEKIALKHAAVK
ncbi:MAG: DUF3786 domain-containing protein [Proteobacteria bacterium]|nr:DUF3786 domain-containing protein [Pseudomonadota bacterium]MBU1739828.1 DUF3786 domain-containing protein [Pseudomonadota bacterium]